SIVGRGLTTGRGVGGWLVMLGRALGGVDGGPLAAPPAACQSEDRPDRASAPMTTNASSSTAVPSGSGLRRVDRGVLATGRRGGLAGRTAVGRGTSTRVVSAPWSYGPTSAIAPAVASGATAGVRVDRSRAATSPVVKAFKEGRPPGS